ncbi:DNA sulfur modification protein DndB [Pseudomonas luteola]|uniref:hypothetical protein n=1 Tax=Pseudomonas luteola TaxID=47886 RepID=UPI003A8900C5
MNTDDYADLYDESIFNKSFLGIYGTFTPEDSPPLEYLLTNINLSDFDDLNTAADITEFENVTFEELIQRDIDFDRVDEELINNYLNKSNDDVKFFPPLLISLVPTDNSHEPEHNELSKDERKFTTTFGGNKFQLELLVKKNPTPYSLKYKDKILYHAPIATINVNLSAAKLVVIDGQHRFEALRRMSRNKDQKRHIERVQVPVCIFFTRRDLTETTNKDLRQLFVTINSKQKEVSGHFIVLLDDKKLSSHVVRGLANKWKNELITPSRSALPLLEWNTRQSRSAYRRQRNYSITTISIIADSFSKHIFADPKKGYAGPLLRFDQTKGTESSINFSDLDDTNFDFDDLPELKERISSNIIEPVNFLFRKPIPYKKFSDVFTSKIREYEELASKQTVGIEYYLKEVIYKYRRCSKQELDVHKDAEKKFEESFKPLNETYYIYLTLIFQQSLLRTWAKLAEQLVKYEISPFSTAKALTEALNQFCFNNEDNLFDARHPYTQLSLYEGQRLIQNDGSRSAWVNLIIGSLLNKKSTKALKISLTSGGEISSGWEEQIKTIATDALDTFLRELKSKITDDLKSNWQHKDLPLNDLNELDTFSKRVESRALFEKKVNELANAKWEEAKKSLYAAIGIE